MLDHTDATFCVKGKDMSQDDKEFMSNHRIRIGGGQLSDTEQDQIDRGDRIIIQAFSFLSLPKNVGLQALAECIYANLSHSVNTKEEFMVLVYKYIEEFFIPQAEKMSEFIVKKMLEVREKEKKLSEARGEARYPIGAHQNITEAPKPIGVNVIQGTSIEEVIAKARELMQQYVADSGSCDCPVCTAERELIAQGKTSDPTTKH